jgi:hypothetical protein
VDALAFAIAAHVVVGAVEAVVALTDGVLVDAEVLAALKTTWTNPFGVADAFFVGLLALAVTAHVVTRTVGVFEARARLVVVDTHTAAALLVFATVVVLLAFAFVLAPVGAALLILVALVAAVLAVVRVVQVHAHFVFAVFVSAALLRCGTHVVAAVAVVFVVDFGVAHPAVEAVTKSSRAARALQRSLESSARRLDVGSLSLSLSLWSLSLALWSRSLLSRSWLIALVLHANVVSVAADVTAFVAAHRHALNVVTRSALAARGEDV